MATPFILETSRGSQSRGFVFLRISSHNFLKGRMTLIKPSPTMDKLEMMFEKQLILARNFIPIDDIISGKMPPMEQEKHLLTYCNLLIEEIIEVQRNIPSRKFWRKHLSEKVMDRSAVLEEIADCWHIIIAISLIAGMTAEDMYDAYRHKNDINLKRVISDAEEYAKSRIQVQ